MNLLHLSDLHLQSHDQAEAQLGQLDLDLRDALGFGSLDAIIVSGDISVYAKPEEFVVSLWFLQQLMSDFSVSAERLVLVPGNHDVDWSATKQALIPIAKTDLREAQKHFPHELDPALVYKVDDTLYAGRFKNFSDFYTRLYGKSYPTDVADQYDVWVFREHRTVIVGLNSAWDLNHAAAGTPSVHPRALTRALRKVRELAPDPSWTRIAVWHHPINSRGDDRIRDDGFVQQLAQMGFALSLHGHIHEISTESFQYEWGPGAELMHILAAGTFGAATKELPTGTPWEYNVMVLQGGYVEIQARQRRASNGIWGPYGAWRTGATDVAASINLRLRGRSPEARPLLKTRTELLRYLEEQGIRPDGYRIAVEAHIFDKNGRILLQKRGPKARDEVGRYEGVGGDIRRQTDLQDALLAEVRDELGSEVEVRIDELLEVRRVPFVERDHDVQEWLIASYLCRLVGGKPRMVNPDRTAELRYFTVQELMLHSHGELSRSTIAAISTYWSRYGNKPYFDVRQAE